MIRGLKFEAYYYWLSVGALFGFSLLFNIGFTLALTYLKDPGNSHGIIPHEKNYLPKEEDFNIDPKLEHMQTRDPPTFADKRQGKMALPFEPLCITFQDVQYSIDTPQRMKLGTMTESLQLLQNITGSFRPRVLTALMCVSGAGKTTLMDVLCGRKRGGNIQGDIRIGGYPKLWLRLPPQTYNSIKEFVEEILQIVELDKIKDALVGIPCVTGLSTEQRKRLTIAVELVANPSILFTDEPTSGLDARSAAIVMRAVRKIGDTGRTVVCTIHQPSVEIFESFDELFLMRRGGQTIYFGPLGNQSSELIAYFEDKSGRLQKLVKLKLSTGETTTPYVRTMTPETPLEGKDPKKNLPECEAPDSKRPRLSLNKCDHAEEIERLRQEIRYRDEEKAYLQKVISLREEEIKSLQKIVSAITRKHGL